ncbi:MAG TPA: 3-dehydroquinate dehydratase [Candidatus Stercoripulliclostridium merdigallinarum]|uniref:3-dehydroquinate dehydratase n=1 Tax=Candidatus Stercoripulliclostridium merdigallinarum TaxID=2840951 RepID=A0A9D1SHZ1_9FIRM|nr:3-dehydroquinate dehydratase [Candidatus Stercoripulliclostridium merdigallinarum]
MKKVLVVNGANLNMLGIREPDLYGRADYGALKKFIQEEAAFLGMQVEIVQSNYEGEIVGFIQKALGVFDGIVINAGGYTHTSVVILDALKAVGLPTVEVHLTDIYSREEFRRFSYISLYAEKTIAGKGFNGYKEALEYLNEVI